MNVCLMIVSMGLSNRTAAYMLGPTSTYSVMYKSRGNSSLDRNALYGAIGELMAEQSSHCGGGVNLANPTWVVMCQMVPALAALAPRHPTTPTPPTTVAPPPPPLTLSLMTRAACLTVLAEALETEMSRGTQRRPCAARCHSDGLGRGSWAAGGTPSVLAEACRCAGAAAEREHPVRDTPRHRAGWADVT